MYDVTVVGSGWAGSWAAKELAEAGLSVLLLEAGPRLDPGVMLRGPGWHRARHESAAQSQFIQCRHPAYWQKNPALFVNDRDHPYSCPAEESFVWIRGRQLGGRSLTWGGVMPRFSDFEFKAAQLDGHGADWPLEYRDLQPFYDEVEQFLRVQGGLEDSPTSPAGRYAGAAPVSVAESALKHHIEMRWPDRAALACPSMPDTRAAEPHEWPPECTLHSLIPTALRTGKLTIRTDTIAASLTLNSAADRVTEVVCVDRNSRERSRLPVRAVMLCASTIESTRILLNSRGERHPLGAANSSGLVGRYLLDHAAAWMGGYIPDSQSRAIDADRQGHGLLIPRFQNVVERESEFLRGYGIWATAGHTRWPRTRAQAWSLCAMIEVLPDAGNAIQIDPNSQDAWGVCVPSIRMAYARNEEKLLRHAERSMQELAESLNWRIEHRGRTAPGGLVHELGGARMGADAVSSVLNRYNQAWDCPNLFVADGACFVSSGWQNPGLTGMALSLRAARYVAGEMSRGHL